MAGTVRRMAAGALIGIWLLTATPARAAGDDALQQASTMMWVITVAELALVVTAAGVASIGALATLGGGGSGGGGGDLGLALIGTPLLLGIGAGYASMEEDWDPHLAAAMHQGLWSGGGLAAWGYVLGQHLDDGTPWPTLASALGLGLLGVAGGAALGGLLVDSETEVWLAYGAPLAAGLAGVGAWATWTLAADAGAAPDPDELELTTAIVAAATAPLLLAALGVGAISVVQALE